MIASSLDASRFTHHSPLTRVSASQVVRNLSCRGPQTSVETCPTELPRSRLRCRRCRQLRRLLKGTLLPQYYRPNITHYSVLQEPRRSTSTVSRCAACGLQKLWQLMSTSADRCDEVSPAIVFAEQIGAMTEPVVLKRLLNSPQATSDHRRCCNARRVHEICPSGYRFRAAPSLNETLLLWY